MFKLSSEASLAGVVAVENKFIVEYMPYADGDFVKVYLYGLSLAARKSDPDDNIERLARRLGLDRAVVDAAINYWCDLGLMARLGDEITYMSLKTARPKIKKFDVDKYAEFNRQAQLYISARQIAPNEYHEYYSLMEKYGIEWQAMVLIVNYCVKLKDDNVSCPYILAVARNLAEDGYRTHDEVENRLEEFGVYYNDLCAVLSAMGGKRPDHDAVNLYKKWVNVYKFDAKTILAVASTVKRGGMAMLDSRLTAYRDLGLMTADKIAAYESDRQDQFKLAKTVNKALGVFYENVEPELVAYIRPWLELGFEPRAIVALAEHCMKTGLKTLPDLDAVIRSFLAMGATTEAAVMESLSAEARYDEKIEKIMHTLGIRGAVKPAFRTFYSNWSEKWCMPSEVIDYAATLSAGKTFSYVNAILSAWNEKNARTLDAVKALGTRDYEVAAAAATAPLSGGNVVEKISADELNALFTHLSEDE